MANIRKGDLVQVITGPTQERGGDRGKQGRVITVLGDQDRVIVEGVKQLHQAFGRVAFDTHGVLGAPDKLGHRCRAEALFHRFAHIVLADKIDTRWLGRRGRG
jgi:hypothetical protein